MTDSTAGAMTTPNKSSSFWEDIIDIFISPADVFRRREHKSVWPPLLFVAIATGIITFATFNALAPVFDAEFARNTAKAVAQNPQAAAGMEKARGFMEVGVKWGAAPGILVTVFVLGVITWLVGKLFGSKQTFEAAIGVAAWAYMPRVLGAVIGGVQGLMLDPAKLTGAAAISLSPARFFDPDSTNAVLMAVLTRFDLITIWVTVILAVGLYVTGKVSKEKAVIFGIVMWLLGMLPSLRQAYMSM